MDWRGVLLALLLCGAASANDFIGNWVNGRAWIPSSLFDGVNDRAVLVATLSLGLPPKPTEVMLDFTSSAVAVGYNPLAQSSAAYAAAGTVFDVLRLGW
ncbi:MAG TPA: hypothetical protein VKD22_04935, partial [Ramlibacter sp.]|nr:hypothetical protein [Ramlibacter sp.]